MNDTQRYFVEEFAEEYLEGRMSRRDMLRRVMLITGGVASAATTLLALGCGKDNDNTTARTTTTSASATPAATGTTEATRTATAQASAAPSPAATSASSTLGAATLPPAQQSNDLLVPESDPSVQAGRVQFPGPAGTVLGYYARPKTGGPWRGIILVHENMGLVEPNMDVARRYAKEGFAALAVDLVSREGGTDKYQSDPAQIPAILGRIAMTDLVADLQAGLTWLKAQDGVKQGAYGVSGFCFGGNMTFGLATAAPEIAAAVPYYGQARLDDLPKSKAAFLAFYGQADTRVTSQAQAVEQALKQAGRPVEIRIEPGAAHAFFRNNGASYNPAAARDAWPRTLAWFTQYL
jgi:carboxymethylenebutenolidase